MVGNNANHTNLKELSIMTTKTTRTAKPANAKPAFNAVGKATEAGQCEVTAGTAKAMINGITSELHKKKIKVGTLKSDCAVMAAFIRPQHEAGYAEQTIKNNATRFRKAVNEGVPYDVNGYRKKGAKTAEGESESVAVKLTITKGADSYEVAEGLRGAINSEKFRESYAELAAFLTDALDEFQGK
jgi:hypothetical protein